MVVYLFLQRTESERTWAYGLQTIPRVNKDDKEDEARELNKVYASLNAVLLELLETSNSAGRAEELRTLSSEMAKKSERLEVKKSMREGKS